MCYNTTTTNCLADPIVTNTLIVLQQMTKTGTKTLRTKKIRDKTRVTYFEIKGIGCVPRGLRYLFPLVSITHFKPPRISILFMSFLPIHFEFEPSLTCFHFLSFPRFPSERHSSIIDKSRVNG